MTDNAKLAVSSTAASVSAAASIYGNQKDTAILWFVELATKTGYILRFVKNPLPVDFQFEEGSGDPITWNAGSFEVSSVTTNTDGEIGELEVAIQNVTREIGAYLEFQEGLVGSTVRVMLADVALLGTSTPLLEYQGEVLDTTATESVASFRVGRRALKKALFPSRRANRDYCRHSYGDIFCGYNVESTESSYLPTCDKTLEGPNGCQVHGQSQVAAGLTQTLPGNFGGFPGLLRIGGLGT